MFVRRSPGLPAMLLPQLICLFEQRGTTTSVTSGLPARMSSAMAGLRPLHGAGLGAGSARAGSAPKPRVSEAAIAAIEERKLAGLFMVVPGPRGRALPA